jgi:protein-disulfide isomerase
VSPWVPRLALGLTAAALIAALVTLAVGEGGPTPQEIGGVNEVQRLFGGIEQEGADLGPDEAEVTATVFNDLQCTSCADFQLSEIDPLIEEYARTDEVRFELRHFAISGHDTVRAAYAATAAGEQGRQWQYADLFLRNQDLAASEGVTDELLREFAESVPELETEQWDDDLDSSEVAERVEADARLGAELELPAEPAVVVTGPGGESTLIDTPSREQIEAAIAEVS